MGKNKIGMAFLIWGCVVVAYIILAVLIPVYSQLSQDVSAELASTSNMSNYPGSKEMVDGFPLWAWLVPGGLGILATVYEFKVKNNER